MIPFIVRRFILLMFGSIGVLLLIAQNDHAEKHRRVAMRMIGHQVLLLNQDSLSRVMPIKKEGERYLIEFESDFAFTPLDLNKVIDSVMKVAAVAESYLVEVERCDTQVVVYSYEISDSASRAMVPCGPRPQPRACYRLFIGLLDGSSMIDPPNEEQSYSNLIVILPLLFLIGLFFYFRSRWRISHANLNLIPLGVYRFDKRNMKLSHNNESVELSSKEADLLYLLYSSANTTLDRDHILKIVWGDDGDYVGRTLDVFISKLRKKLDADTNLKIVNVRGVGYKLVLNN